MASLRLFGPARVAAGAGRDEVEGATVGDVLQRACDRYGGEFARLLPSCQIWVNGDPSGPERAVSALDEVAVLPPVSGG